jgi:hypothetical protein
MPTDVDALVAPWVAALNTRPFGEASGVRATPASREQVARIDRAIAALVAVPRDATVGGSQGRITLLSAAGSRCGDLESARLLGWVLQTALREDVPRAEAPRMAAIESLGKTLALDFPSPAYPQPPSPEQPFWQTSLSAARDADINRIRAAFQLQLPR